jgi:hypothetical protein
VRIPVISLWRPWANWVALEWKLIETRTHQRFKGLVGKRIGIHGSLKWDDGAIELATPWLSDKRAAMTRDFLKLGGAIICTAYAVNHRELDSLDNHQALIDCTHVTRYGLILRDIQSIEAIPCKGKQGIWYHEIPEVTSVPEPRL